jgi:50S ribosomal protein L16 3-hydroxylase
MKLQLLGGLTAPEFLSRHWQKKPMLARKAIPAFKDALQATELFRLAARDDVESRLVRGTGTRLSLDHGPFRTSALRSLPKCNWTLLVQGLNLHNPAARRLLRRFSFIPYARLDDVMVSYAAPGGGVGPHIDSYDVFLLQGKGRRLWRIGRSRNPQLVKNSPLRILRNFEPAEEYLLEAGDLLYLPPGWGHEGVALDECMTYSIGFRAPARRELLSEYLVRTSEHITVPGLYEDPDLRAQTRPAEISAMMIDKVMQLVSSLRHTRKGVRDFLGEYLSEPKPNIVFNRPGAALAPARFAQLACLQGVRLDPRTIMLHSGDRLFINGECLALQTRLAKSLTQLGNERSLSPARRGRALCALLHEWHGAGWLHLGNNDNL